MSNLVEFVFWGSVFLLIYPYLVYPAVVLCVARVWPKPVRLGPLEPPVSILIPAYNEADCILATITNKLDLDYPASKLQIVVISDGSDDGTDDIVRQFSERGVILLRREGREGKAAALNEAVTLATGQIVVFSDANSLFDQDALRRIVENFSDSEVGYVTGSLRLSDASDAGLATAGGGAYLRYENWLRSLETRMGSIIGVNGGVDAIRRDLYTEIPKNLITDFVLPLSVIARGKRVVFDARIRSRETANTELSAEFRMRVRVALRALQGLAYMRQLLNPLRFPLASFCIVSHKLLRYMAFIFMVSALATNLVLATTSHFYQVVLATHLLGYVLALLGIYFDLPRPIRRFTGAPGYLLMTYLAFAVATLRFVRGDSMAIWRPRSG